MSDTVTVRLEEDAGRYNAAGTLFEPGDEKEVDEATANRLLDTGRFIEVVEAEDVETVDPDEMTPICGEKKSDGEPCTREVDEHGAKCWQHEDDEEGDG